MRVLIGCEFSGIVRDAFNRAGHYAVSCDLLPSEKATCLWLKGLPKLIPTSIVEGREQRVFRMGPSEERTKMRSKTYEGVASAMATQWGVLE